MKIKLFATFLALFFFTGVFAQLNVNNYKYVIIPNKFDFLKQANQYRLNELARFLFNKYGFTALLEGTDYPEDLMFKPCLGLRSNVYKDSGIFKTKLKLELKDCNGKLVYVSMGESRAKDYQEAYNEALRGAFKDLQTLNYKYKPSAKVASNTSQQPKKEVSQEIQKLKEEIETLKAQKEVKAEQSINEVVEVEESVETTVNNVNTKSKILTNVLYAQEIANGFQLVDSSPKVVFKIKNTGLKNVFLVEGKNAVMYKKTDAWFMEYYEGGTLKQEVLKIKF